MSPLKTVATVALGALATLSVAASAQNGPAAPTATLVLDSHDQLATIDWIEKSDVAALREGVIEKMELRLGDAAQEGAEIGSLHKEIAELTVAKSKLTAESKGSVERPGPPARSPRRPSPATAAWSPARPTSSPRRR